MVTRVLNRTTTGRADVLDEPHWGPLERLLGDEQLLGGFMAMFVVDLRGGSRVYAYKHVVTRRYLHLADDGRAFEYVPVGRYRQVKADALLEAALRPWWDYLSASDEEVAASRAAIARARAARADAEPAGEARRPN